MRITTGLYKGRIINVPKGDITRPTTDKMRQAIFNVLTHAGEIDLDAAGKCLDMYGGSGAMGIEALSRGLCAHVTFIEKSQKVAAVLKQNCTKVLPDETYKIIQSDALNAPFESYNLIFLDPPYHKGLVEKSLRRLQEVGALNEGCVLVMEAEKEAVLNFPKNLKVFQQKEYGLSRIYFCTKKD